MKFSVPVHTADGGRGLSRTAKPGELTSTGRSPVARRPAPRVHARHEQRAAAAWRRDVHAVQREGGLCPRGAAGAEPPESPVVRPPVSMRSPTTSGTDASMSEYRLELDGRFAARLRVMTLPSGNAPWCRQPELHTRWPTPAPPAQPLQTDEGILITGNISLSDLGGLRVDRRSVVSIGRRLRRFLPNTHAITMLSR